MKGKDILLLYQKERNVRAKGKPTLSKMQITWYRKTWYRKTYKTDHPISFENNKRNHKASIKEKGKPFVSNMHTLWSKRG